MTTFFEERVTCAMCGCETGFTIIGSTNEFGHPDLDTRPPEMARSTMQWWVQECPGCGYCSGDIGEVTWGERVIVESVAFADFRSGIEDLHPLARTFRTAAFIAAECGHHAGAFFHTLHEVWVHDDLGDSVRANAARLNAVDFMNLVHQEEYEDLFDGNGADTAVKVDLLRRAGAFERAAEICEQMLRHTRYTGAGPIVVFELELCKQRNVECHTLDEVPGRSRA